MAIRKMPKSPPSWRTCRHSESGARFQSLALEAVSQGVTIADATQAGHPIVYANAGFLRLTGYKLEDVLGKDSTFFIGRDANPTSRSQISDAIRDGQSRTLLLCNHRKDGTPFWHQLRISPKFDANGQMTDIVGLHDDVTERQMLEGRHRESHKMETMGQLAYGIAHDFNNLLTVITAYSDLLLQSSEVDRSALERIGAISKASEQAASLARQLQAFGRQQLAPYVLVDLNTIIRDVEEILRRVTGDGIEVSIVLEPGLPPVIADPGQLSQILLDLSASAHNVLPHGGKIVIETKNGESTDKRAGLSSGALPGQCVMLTATFTVAGITRETMNRIFESDEATRAGIH